MIKYPRTTVRRVVDSIHGHKVVDPYRWLENSKSKAVIKWVEEQNAITNKIISSKLRETFASGVKRHTYFPFIGIFYKTGPFYFNWERQPDQQQSVLFIRKGLQGKKRVLIDPNTLSKDKTVSIDLWVQSRSGLYLVYDKSTNGEEKPEMHLMDTRTGKDVEKIANNASGSSVCWLPDDSGFFYTKNPDRGTVPVDDERYFQKLYYHMLGTDSRDDELVFGIDRPKEDMLSISLSENGEWLSIRVAQDWVQNNIFIYHVPTKKLKPLIVGVKASSGLSFAGERAFLFTDHQAPNEKILTAPIDDMPTDITQWDLLIPESEYRITGFSQTKEKLLVTYMINAKKRTYVYTYAGKRVKELPIPEQASIDAISCSPYDSEYFYQYVSHISACVRYRYIPGTKRYEKIYESPTLIKSENYKVSQEWCISKDGTKVPLFIIHHKKVRCTGSNPTILYGYGGYDISLTPNFLRSYMPWLERGGIFVEANIRGGGEFGKGWHTSAVRKNKQRSYDDFIAASEYLISRGYTDAEHLGISGGSNGGLLVSAVATQRPELYKAVKASVPLTDMVRFPLTHIASRWTSEYGDPSKARDLPFILKYSPYHNVKPGMLYPAFLFTTGLNDTRVDPLHARKMAALLQASSSSDNPVLIFTDGLGHTGALTIDKFYENSGRSLAFFAQQLGLKI